MRSISCCKQSIGKNRKESNAKYSSNKFIIMNFHFAVFHSFFSSHLICVLACRSLGLTKIKTPPGHHRKRLAVESSRHHSRPDDSHMFIIKLPPNPYYYANSNTAQNKNGIEDKNQKVRSLVDHIFTPSVRIGMMLNECFRVHLPKSASVNHIKNAWDCWMTLNWKNFRNSANGVPLLVKKIRIEKWNAEIEASEFPYQMNHIMVFCTVFLHRSNVEAKKT